MLKHHKHSITHKVEPRNRVHKVSANAHKKGHLKMSVAKKGVKKHGSKKTMLT